jgi:hypothetical protein
MFKRNRQQKARCYSQELDNGDCTIERKRRITFKGLPAIYREFEEKYNIRVKYSEKKPLEKAEFLVMLAFIDPAAFYNEMVNPDQEVVDSFRRMFEKTIAGSSGDSLVNVIRGSLDLPHEHEVTQKIRTLVENMENFKNSEPKSSMKMTKTMRLRLELARETKIRCETHEFVHYVIKLKDRKNKNWFKNSSKGKGKYKYVQELVESCLCYTEEKAKEFIKTHNLKEEVLKFLKEKQERQIKNYESAVKPGKMEGVDSILFRFWSFKIKELFKRFQMWEELPKKNKFATVRRRYKSFKPTFDFCYKAMLLFSCLLGEKEDTKFGRLLREKNGIYFGVLASWMLAARRECTLIFEFNENLRNNKNFGPHIFEQWMDKSMEIPDNYDSKIRLFMKMASRDDKIRIYQAFLNVVDQEDMFYKAGRMSDSILECLAIKFAPFLGMTCHSPEQRMFKDSIPNFFKKFNKMCFIQDPKYTIKFVDYLIKSRQYNILNKYILEPYFNYDFNRNADQAKFIKFYTKALNKSLMNNTEVTLEKLETLKKLDIQLCLDRSVEYYMKSFNVSRMTPEQMIMNPTYQKAYMYMVTLLNETKGAYKGDANAQFIEKDKIKKVIRSALMYKLYKKMVAGKVIREDKEGNKLRYYFNLSDVAKLEAELADTYFGCCLADPSLINEVDVDNMEHKRVMQRFILKLYAPNDFGFMDMIKDEELEEMKRLVSNGSFAQCGIDLTFR